MDLDDLDISGDSSPQIYHVVGVRSSLEGFLVPETLRDGPSGPKIAILWYYICGRYASAANFES